MSLSLNLNEAVLQIKKIVGEAHVFDTEKGIAKLSGDTIPHCTKPLAMVYPGSAEEVQKIVLLANQCGLKLWVCSKGKNWGYGATTAVLERSIILILERMNQILEVNQELAYAQIEPGVTYQQLYDYLKDKKIPLWIDCTDGTPEGSVIGNALDKGIGYTPYGDHFEHLCGIEAVLPTGEIVRTGGGSSRAFPTWNTHKWGTGPYLEGLFTQSNFGIVTKAGIWLMPEPECFRSVMFRLKRREDFTKVIETIRTLSLGGIIQSRLHMANDHSTLSVMAPYPYELLNGRTHLSEDQMAMLRKKYHLPYWLFSAGLYGTSEEVQLKQKVIKKALGRYGELLFSSDAKIEKIRSIVKFAKSMEGKPVLGTLKTAIENVFDISINLLEGLPYQHEILKGKPNEHILRLAYFKNGEARPEKNLDPVRDECGLLWFAPVAPMTPEHIQSVLQLCKPAFERHGFDMPVALIRINPRSMIILMSISFRKNKKEEIERTQKLFAELCEITLKAGYQQYRTNVAWMERLFKDIPEFANLISKLKAALDPNDVLAPGKYGIKNPSKINVSEE